MDSESQGNSACSSLARPDQPSGQLPDCQSLHHTDPCNRRFMGLSHVLWGLADVGLQRHRMEAVETQLPGPWWECVLPMGRCSLVQCSPHSSPIAHTLKTCLPTQEAAGVLSPCWSWASNTSTSEVCDQERLLSIFRFLSLNAGGILMSKIGDAWGIVWCGQKKLSLC